VRRATAWILASVGVAIAVALVGMARPATIGALVAGSQPRGVALAFAGSTLVLLLRGLRLAVVAGSRLRLSRAVALVGVASAAAALMPLRTGDLALIPLLRTVGVPGTIRGFSLLVSLRLLDLAGLLLWVLVAAVALGGRYGWAVLPLAAVPLLAAAGVGLAGRWLRRVARRWRRTGGVRRRALRQLLQVRRELREAARSPRRAGGALLLSFAIWGGIWAFTTTLVRAMGLAWPSSAVLLGVVGASVGAALPLNAFGNFGTLEAGWTAALAAVGVPASEALAAGFATHLFSVVFVAVLGAASGLYLALVHPRSGAR
jgi:uncharacterized membrane protein YbhN (UPF0104 family)